MSKVTGFAGRGKGKKKVTLNFRGKLSAAHWAEFKSKLRALVDRYQGIDVHRPGAKKRKKKKAG